MKVKYLGENVELTFTHGSIYEVAGIDENSYILWDDDDEPSECPIGELEVIEGDKSEVCHFAIDSKDGSHKLIKKGSKENMQAWKEYDDLWHIFRDNSIFDEI